MIQHIPPGSSRPPACLKCPCPAGNGSSKQPSRCLTDGNTLHTEPFQDGNTLHMKLQWAAETRTTSCDSGPRWKISSDLVTFRWKLHHKELLTFDRNCRNTPPERRVTPHLCLPEKPASFSEHIHGNLRSKKLLLIIIETLSSSSTLKQSTGGDGPGRSCR